MDIPWHDPLMIFTRLIWYATVYMWPVQLLNFFLFLQWINPNSSAINFQHPNQHPQTRCKHHTQLLTHNIWQFSKVLKLETNSICFLRTYIVGRSCSAITMCTIQTIWAGDSVLVFTLLGIFYICSNLKSWN